ncbi:class C beta-lactamase [Rugamonas sp. CCM 8940]|uniref:class C beta-lactamase n=1 Tax=Rugamonas sp. CCM 8940 TaxID=2765359 RepID=UPI0018F42E44|nr:class C beta-lactamase [Rugamonas sp. CCM 8940]MBJ7311516.1 beta-lactamase [Rugamonas sp. CCM 8940]
MNSLPKLRNRIAFVLVSSAFLPLGGWAADDSTATIRAFVDKEIRPIMAEHDVPGMAVAVTLDGQAYFFNYGLASREANIPVSEATLFELGSISKTFTATLASYALVRGKLSLDEHPGKYMPQLKGSAIDRASLLNLATYTAGGLPLQFPEELAHDKMLGYFQQWQAEAAPGVLRRYSNPSIGLFGHITALALKSDFADLMEHQLFAQLGLTSSYVHVPNSAMGKYAWGYNRANKAVRANPDIFADQTYGVKSSAADMIRFVQLNIEPSRLEGPMRRAVEGTHVGYFKTGDMVQGLGWEQYAYPLSLQRLLDGNTSTEITEARPLTTLTPPQAPSGGTLFNKTGATGGFSNYAAFVPEKKIGIVMLANKNYPIPARIKAAYAILQQLAPLAK